MVFKEISVSIAAPSRRSVCLDRYFVSFASVATGIGDGVDPGNVIADTDAELHQKQ